jgi:arginase
MTSRATLIGIPWDRSSSFQLGAADAPDAIRAALWSPSSNSWNDRGDDVSQPRVLGDAGNLSLPDDAAASREAITHALGKLLTEGRHPLVLGGDHSITYPVLRAWQGRGPAPVVLHFDAHGDLYDEFEGDRYSHACPFARVMEEGLAARLIQVGVRTLTGHLRDQVARFGVEVYPPSRWRDAVAVVRALAAPLYISLDIDVLEPMLAPGVSHPEPGGLTPREVLEVLAAVRAPVVGADVVEYNPANDFRHLTAYVAARFVKELAGLFAGRETAG